MCGIAGLIDPTLREDPEGLGRLATSMGDRLAHRGPDDAGTWVEPRWGVGLTHRRLSIFDLSPLGHQPMASADGRWVVTLNGEIYNHLALRGELEGRGHRFRGHSDTEVLLAAFGEWGFEGALRRANGMFAIGAWDAETRTLHLARDRLGEKPLYYGWIGRTFLFGSELKAFAAHPAFRPEIDRTSLGLFLRLKYVPTPRSIYVGVSKLPPGTYATVDPTVPGGVVGPTAFWSAEDAIRRGVEDPLDVAPEEAVDRLEALLLDAVGIRMEADVPLGAFLSGGVDSSTVVALMQAQGSRPVRTFTIGFHEAAFDEAASAAAVARHLGTDHTELYVTPGDAMDVIPRLPEVYDEPFSDSSQIPTYLVSELARRHVTVSLSGDGGDELFGGYHRHVWGGSVGRVVRWTPAGARRAAARALLSVSPARWESVMGAVDPVLPARLRQRNPGDKAHKLATALGAERADLLYLALVSHWDGDVPARGIGGREAGGMAPVTTVADSLSDPANQMMALDLLTYLPDDILAKVDRASMAHALEARPPILDHRVVELAWRMPLSLKIRAGRGKWALRQVLARRVPPALVDRPKMGFGIPIGTWLRGPLRSWAEDLLDPARLREEGYLEPGPIRIRWAEHLSGRRNHQYELWDVLMFQAWLARTRVPAGVGA
jgi:asparagine synthase (glutamine-hydrolysing)